MTAFTHWPDRPSQFAALKTPLDVLVVGGGIVGAGVAWEAALRGLRVAVVEKHDFASGTSSKSSKLLHGGLRYLENFEFGLVFESLAQRNHLFEDAPHVAKRLNFLFPVFKGGKDKGWMLGAGLFIYDMLAALSRPKQRVWHERLSPKRVAAVEPNIRQAGLQAAYRYTDGLTDDSRLVIETLKSAVAEGAIALNHVAVEGFIKDADGRITGVNARDSLDGASFDISARVVFNATGPWADALCKLDNPAARPRLRPTKGVHLITPAILTDHAVVLRTKWPGEASPRVMFVIPWHGRTLIGTTDTAHHGAADDFSYLDKDVEASPEEVAYLLEAVNASFDAKLTPADVLSAFAGWRPLIAPPEAGVSESAISREHEVYSSSSGLITIAGGKLTAYRAMAREGVEAIAQAIAALGDPAVLTRPSRIEHAVLSGSELEGRSPEAFAELQVAAAPGLPAELVRTLATRHGSHWPVLKAMLEAAPALGVSPDDGRSGAPTFYLVEAAYAVRFEAAVTLADFMSRRTRLYLLAADQGLGSAEAFAAVMASELQQVNGWSDAERTRWSNRELASYRAEVALSRAKREREAGAVAAPEERAG